MDAILQHDLIQKLLSLADEIGRTPSKMEYVAAGNSESQMRRVTEMAKVVTSYGRYVREFESRLSRLLTLTPKTTLHVRLFHFAPCCFW